MSEDCDCQYCHCHYLIKVTIRTDGGMDITARMSHADGSDLAFVDRNNIVEMTVAAKVMAEHRLQKMMECIKPEAMDKAQKLIAELTAKYQQYVQTIPYSEGGASS